MLLSRGMHQEAKKQRPPEHQGGCHFEETRFGTLGSAHRAVARSRHRGVSWPGCRIRCHHRTAPDAACILQIATDPRQLYSGTVKGGTKVLFTFTENLITLPVSEEEAK